MSTKSETGLGILFSDLALRISLNFTWNWSIRLFDSSDFNNVYRFESCRRYSWTWPIGFWGRGMQIKGKNQQIHGPYRGLTYSSTTRWHYSEGTRDVHMSHAPRYTRFYILIRYPAQTNIKHLSCNKQPQLGCVNTSRVRPSLLCLHQQNGWK